MSSIMISTRQTSTLCTYPRRFDPTLVAGKNVSNICPSCMHVPHIHQLVKTQMQTTTAYYNI